MHKTSVYLIGMGVEGRNGLSAAQQKTILEQDELWGTERFLAQWPDFGGKTVCFGPGLREQVKRIQDRKPDTRVAILSSGDPNFFGISRILNDLLSPEELILQPAVSSLQVAFARVCVPWDDAVLTSLHTKPIEELIGLAKRHHKIGVLTEPGHSPYWICRQLLQAGIPDCRMVLCEDLGSENEKITDTRLASLEDRSFALLNVILILQEPSSPRCITFREDAAYAHESGMITKRDVRLLSLERLAIADQDTVWDIGAGSGAVSVEMAERAWRGQVFSIERNAVQLAHIHTNRTKFGCNNLKVIPGDAPQVLIGLPLPQAVFLGGSGGNMDTILDHLLALSGLDCRLVANFALIENLTQAMNWFESHRIKTDLSAVSISYGQRIGKGTRLVPINSIFILNAHLKNGEKV
ncbi:MAG: precorrin-6y C5,15-methyltransferase (decarboxylating) subunit CbiE [Anaerolineaceae bacterium]|nr:precorrin-6y C5,15-methyltransferase (decarboxylating) subunit CbiE [Anaerolineaceae bacterium]